MCPKTYDEKLPEVQRASCKNQVAVLTAISCPPSNTWLTYRYLYLYTIDIKLYADQA